MEIIAFSLKTENKKFKTLLFQYLQNKQTLFYILQYQNLHNCWFYNFMENFNSCFKLAAWNLKTWKFGKIIDFPTIKTQFSKINLMKTITITWLNRLWVGKCSRLDFESFGTLVCLCWDFNQVNWICWLHNFG
jgi:hypothetical protein